MSLPFQPVLSVGTGDILGVGKPVDILPDFTTINQCDMCNNYYKSWQFFYNLLSNDKAF
jgi:hypothetical protein